MQSTEAAGKKVFACVLWIFRVDIVAKYVCTYGIYISRNSRRSLRGIRVSAYEISRDAASSTPSQHEQVRQSYNKAHRCASKREIPPCKMLFRAKNRSRKAERRALFARQHTQSRTQLTSVKKAAVKQIAFCVKCFRSEIRQGKNAEKKDRRTC